VRGSPLRRVAVDFGALELPAPRSTSISGSTLGRRKADDRRSLRRKSNGPTRAEIVPVGVQNQLILTRQSRERPCVTSRNDKSADV
jgi:hypothetical protein